MAKMTASDTRVEPGVGSFEGHWFGYAKRDVNHDDEDLYAYRYDELGPFKSKDEAQTAADKAFAKMPKPKATTNAAYEEGGKGAQLAELRKQTGDNPAKRNADVGEVR